MVIWKFPLKPGLLQQTILAPYGTVFLTAQIQGRSDIVLWGEVWSDNRDVLKTYIVHVYMTGEEIKDLQGKYLSTVQLPSGLVAHIYVEGI